MTPAPDPPGAPAEPALKPPSRGGGRLLVVAPFLVFAALAALFYLRLGAGDASRIPSALIGKQVPQFRLPTMTVAPDGTVGKPARMLTDADLRQGRVTLLNVFASWCGPCQEEHTLLLQLSSDAALAALGVRLIGLNYKDADSDAGRFLQQGGNPYAEIGVDQSGRTGIDFGVYGVPETFVIKGDGTIAFKYIGPLTEEGLTKTLLPEVAKAAG